MLYLFGINFVYDFICVCFIKINFVNWYIIIYYFDYKWKRKCCMDK